VVLAALLLLLLLLAVVLSTVPSATRRVRLGVAATGALVALKTCIARHPNNAKPIVSVAHQIVACSGLHAPFARGFVLWT
jgi:hypothetical protein